MDNTSHHSKTWSDADIRMYLNGELSPRDRHDLERAALDDPFLADALEGLTTVPPGDTGLDDLRSRLAARVEEKHQRLAIGWFRRPALRAAAVVIGLAGIGLTAYYTLFERHQPREKADVAKTVTVPAQTAPDHLPQPAAAAADSTAIVSSGLYANPDDRNVVKKRSIVRSRPPEELAKDAQKPLSPDSLIVLRDIASAPQPAMLPPADRAKASKAEPSQGYRDAYLKTVQDSLKLDAEHLVLSGRVVDNNNRPLAGASVFLNNAPKTMTTTDAFGNFNFRIQPRDTTRQMTVALVGYKQTLVSLNNNALTNNVIQLEQAKANLDEVVVTGFGAQRKAFFATAPSDAGKERLDTAWQKAAPVIGKFAYQQYLDTAKRSLKLDSTIFGTESISFQVDQKGQITEYKIEHSLSPAHDAALIQLISTGPSWRVLRGRNARTLVSLSFP